MSDRPVAEVAEQARRLEGAYRELGSTVGSPYMILSFLSLGVIPALRLTNRGLVDGRSFELVPVVVA
jgi:adenine deaminase